MNTIDTFFLNTVTNTILKNNLLAPADSLLIGVSGGADSIALLNVMLDLQKQIPVKIGIAHLNHDLRGDESERDTAFVRELANRLGLEFHMEKVNVKAYQQKHRLSLEDAARQLRYRFFHETATKHGYSKIGTAHTANDNAELVLMNLIRGSGTAGLSGIPVMRNKIIRPLIEVRRDDIIDYLSVKKADYITDSSNSDKRFLRNRIRLDLLPQIETDYNARIIKSLNRTSQIIREDDEWMEDIIKPLFNDAVSFKGKRTISLSVSSLSALSLAPKRRILRKAIESIKGDLKTITLFHTDMVIGLLNNRKSYLSVDMPGQIKAQKKDNLLILTRHDENLRDLTPESVIFNHLIHSLDKPLTTVLIPEIQGEMHLRLIDNAGQVDFQNEKQPTAWIDYSNLIFPLTIRSLRPGDRFIPFGMTGSQSLKKFFSSRGIKMDDKKKCPLLVSNNDIVWVGGYRLHNNYKIGKKTKKILKVELLLD